MEGIDYVTCCICNKRFEYYIGVRHLAEHNISREDYLTKFPNAIMSSVKHKKLQSRPKEQNGSWKKPEDRASKDHQRRKANERMLRYRLKNEVDKSIKKYQGVEGIDFVVCQLCGKRSLYIDNRHVTNRHNLTREEYKKKFPSAVMYCEVFKESQSRPNNKGNLGKKFSKQHKDKIALSKFGELNPSWRGGISCEPYCEVWLDKDYKESIKDRDKHKCQNPECWKTSNKIVIHHIDYNKKNCHPTNLITVCDSCNTRANHRRKYWQKLYTKLINKMEIS